MHIFNFWNVIATAPEVLLSFDEIDILFIESMTWSSVRYACEVADTGNNISSSGIEEAK